MMVFLNREQHSGPDGCFLRHISKDTILGPKKAFLGSLPQGSALGRKNGKLLSVFFYKDATELRERKRGTKLK